MTEENEKNIQTMTKDRLEQYRSMKEEIKEIDYKIKQLHESDCMIGNDVILDYRTGYGMPQTIVGVDEEKRAKAKKRYQKLKDKLLHECSEIEDFINSIDDSITRRIFRMCYIDGFSQRSIGKAVHIDQSRVSRKIDDYFKNA